MPGEERAVEVPPDILVASILWLDGGTTLAALPTGGWWLPIGAGITLLGGEVEWLEEALELPHTGEFSILRL